MLYLSPYRVAARIAFVAVSLIPGPALAQRTGAYFNGTFPDRPPGIVDQWRLAEAFQPRFDKVMDIDAVPGSTRLSVASRDGRIYTFDKQAGNAQKTLLADLSNVVAVVTDGGFMGVAFHPHFGQQGAAHAEHVYFAYCANDTGSYPSQATSGFYDCYLRLSRFTVPTGTWTIDPQSEVRMLNLRLYNATHRGGNITFGPDGYLYMPIGDQVRLPHAQSIDDNLDGGILRICVNCDPQYSHPPRRTLPLQHQDEFSGVGYWIPNDNPFIDPNGSVFEEYYALGFRNPHKISFDPQTNELWCSDVGAAQREEINRVASGSNCQWPYLEGELPGPIIQRDPALGQWTDPAKTFDHQLVNAIIGGGVYGAVRLPSLAGKYLCGDFISGRLLAVTFDPANGSARHQELLTHAPGRISAFGQDLDGDLYIGLLSHNQPLFRLERSGQAVAEPPVRLSQVGAFRDLSTLQPAPGWVPFEPMHPFWSDHAIKRRWIALPAGTERIRMSKRGDWTLPPGTVVMKHFDLPLDRRGPRPRQIRRLETRFLVVDTEGHPYGLTYRWLADGSDALLLSDGARDVFSVQTPTGMIQQTWEYPSRQQCLSCHTEASGGFLGIRTHQLNGPYAYSQRDADHRRPENQLARWSRLGMLAPPVDQEGLDGLPRAVALDDPSATLELRVKSYLDANCASCHRPDTSLRAGFDARFSSPLWAQDLVDGTVVNDLGIPGARTVAPGAPGQSLTLHRIAAPAGAIAMPPIGRHAIDAQGHGLLAQWIQSLSNTEFHANVGNPLATLPQQETWHQSLVINKTDTWTNLDAVAETVRIEAVRMVVDRAEGWWTPFAVKILGPDQFAVVAIGTPREAQTLHEGFNALPFADGPTPTVAVAPGEVLAFGFMDSLPNGSRSAPGGIVPYCTCNRGDAVWISGSALTSGTPASIQLGNAPAQGTDVLNDRREYAWSVDIVY